MLRATRASAASLKDIDDLAYLPGMKFAEDLLQPGHFAEAEKAAAEIDPRDYGLDVIAFVVRALPEGLEAILGVADDATLSEDQVRAMFAQSS
jgi:hypothetical protein